MKYYLPESLVYGVSYERFMDSSPRELEPWKLAHEKKMELNDINNWTLGLYIQRAIGSSLSKKNQYPKEPFGIKKEMQAEEGLSDAERFELWAKSFNKTLKQDKEP